MFRNLFGGFGVSEIDHIVLPSKYARSGLELMEVFWLYFIVSYDHFGQRAARIRLEVCSQNRARSYIYQIQFLYPIQFGSSKEGPDHLVQNQSRSCLDGLVSFWPNISGLEASQCPRIMWPDSGWMQLAPYQFPTFRLECILPQIV